MTEAQGTLFWAKVKPDPGLGACWRWQRWKIPQGYGCCKIGQVNLRAHRVAYVQHVGPIPEGLEIDHLCRNKDCVNPAHLEAVTGKVNTRRAVYGTHCKRGHELTPENTYRRRGFKAGRSGSVGTRDGHRECRTCHRARGGKP